MVTNNARSVALMSLRRSLPDNLATRIVNQSSKNHRYNEKLKNTRRRTNVGHLPNNLIREINTLAELHLYSGLRQQLKTAKAHRSVKGLKLAQDERNKQRNKEINARLRALQNGKLTPENFRKLLLQSIEMKPRYTPFY
jgi:hypothetical protein